MNEETHKFNQNSVLIVLLKTATPIVILMFFNSMYAFIDSAMSSNLVSYDNHTASSSIGLVFPFMGLINAFAIFHTVGTGLAYTKSIAKKDYPEAQKVLGQSLTLSFLVGLILVIAVAIIGIPYLSIASGNWGNNNEWGTDAHEMIFDAYYYMLIIGVALIPLSLSQAFIRVLRAEGKGGAAAIIPILTLPINIGFDYLFMGVFDFGLAGAGLATLIAATIGILIMLSYVLFLQREKATKIKFERVNFKLEKSVILIIFAFGVGSLFRRIFDSASIIALTSFMGNLNITDNAQYSIPDWQSTWTMLTRTINMALMLSLGVAQAMSMLISYYHNSDQNDDVKKTLKYGFYTIIVVQILVVITLIGLEDVLFRLFVNSGDGPPIWNGWSDFTSKLGQVYLIALIWTFIASFQFIPLMFYSGVKKPKLTFYHSLIFNGISVIVYLVFFGIELLVKDPLILFVGLPIAATIAISVIGVMFYKNYKIIFSENTEYSKV